MALHHELSPTSQDLSPKICYTAAGILIHEQKVLLVKHKKLQIWLNPGGHIEGDELPHSAAEREFFEETGVKVQSYDLQGVGSKTGTEVRPDGSFYIPSPILSNVHWVCPENFERRQKDGARYEKLPNWQRGCEQHLGFLYLLQPVAGVEFTQDDTETDGIAWFTLSEVESLETRENIKFEIKTAFGVVSQQDL